MTLYFLNFIFTTYILFIIFIHLLLVKRNFFLLKNINFLSKLSLKHLQFLTKLLITLNTLIIFNFFIRYLSNINWRKGNIILKKKKKENECDIPEEIVRFDRVIVDLAWNFIVEP